MKKGKLFLALCLAMLLTFASLAAEAAARLVDRDASVRDQANIDSGGYCESCNDSDGSEGNSGGGSDNGGDNGGDSSGNVIILE